MIYPVLFVIEKLIVKINEHFDRKKRFLFLVDPTSACSSSATVDYDNGVTIPDVTIGPGMHRLR